MLLLGALASWGRADDRVVALPELFGYVGPVEDGRPDEPLEPRLPPAGDWLRDSPEDAVEEIRIASWNVRQLGASSDLGRRAEVLARFDLLILQEILEKSAALRLLEELLEETDFPWRLVVAHQRSSDTPKGEFPAYLYRSDRVCLEPRSVRYPRAVDEDDFHRVPHYASFRMRGSGAVLTVVNVHLRQPKFPVRQIRREVSQLRGVHREILASEPREDAVLVAGDFNLEGPSRKNFRHLFDLGYRPLIDGEDTRTTFRASEPDEVGRLMSSFYDNIMVYRVEGGAMPEVGHRGVLRLANEYFPGDLNPLTAVRRDFSDHVPVWFSLPRGAPDWGEACAEEAHPPPAPRRRARRRRPRSR